MSAVLQRLPLSEKSANLSTSASKLRNIANIFALFVMASEDVETEREYIQTVMDIKKDFEKQRDQAGYRDDDTLIKLYSNFLTETEKGREGSAGAQSVANEIIEYVKKEVARLETPKGSSRKLSRGRNKQMPDSSAVVVPTTSGGAPQPSQAAAVTAMKGGALLLSPLPLSGGKRKTKKVPKKVLKLFKKGSAKKLRKLMKGGQEAQKIVTAETSEPPAIEEGGRRRSRRGSRKTRRGHAFLY